MKKSMTKSDNKVNNIPRLIHFVYLNEIPLDYIYGGKYLSGLYGTCKLAKEQGYEVNLWVQNPKQFKQQLLKASPILNALLDAEMDINFPCLKVRGIDELDSLMDDFFTSANGFPQGFVNDIRRYIDSEQVRDFNLAAASNLWRLVIMALIGGIYCDLSKTPPKNLAPEHCLFDKILENIQFGFAQKGFGNYLLASEKMHPIVLETLKFIVENYQRIYRVSYQNLTKKENKKLLVLQEQGNGDNEVITFTHISDPVAYARSQNNKKYREASTELINGVYAFDYGKVKFFIERFSQHCFPIKHEIEIAGICCLFDKLVYDFIKGMEIASKGIYSQITPEHAGKIPLKDDLSLNKGMPPLAVIKEDTDIENWRSPRKIYHDESSLLFLSRKNKGRNAVGKFINSHDAPNEEKTFSF